MKMLLEVAVDVRGGNRRSVPHTMTTRACCRLASAALTAAVRGSTRISKRGLRRGSPRGGGERGGDGSGGVREPERTDRASLA
jgi:hypothetical protein